MPSSAFLKGETALVQEKLLASAVIAKYSHFQIQQSHSIDFFQIRR